MCNNKIAIRRKYLFTLYLFFLVDDENLIFLDTRKYLSISIFVNINFIKCIHASLIKISILLIIKKSYNVIYNFYL